MTATEGSLAIIDRASRMLAQAESLSDIKAVHDLASAAVEYARAAHLGKAAQNHAARIKLRAERMSGEVMKELERGNPGGDHTSDAVNTPSDYKQALSDSGTTYQDAHRWQKVAEVPEEAFAEYIAEDAQEITTAGLLAEQKKVQRLAAQEEREAAQREAADLLPEADDRWRLISGSLTDADLADGSLDVIITDPPYPEKYLAVFGELANFAARKLKPGGSLVCMVGQSYLPQIVTALGAQLTYHWTAAYLTPGGQAVQLWERKVNTFWKPLLWYVNGEYSGGWVGDVCRSDVNDNDKRYHHWGQSVSGLADVVARFSAVGDIVCDPFCGGGSTAVAALLSDRRFIGVDIDTDAIDRTRGRIAEVLS